MNSKAIWLISGGPMQVATAQEIKRRGYALILSDRSPQAICRPLAEHFLELDTFDVPGHLAAAAGLKEKYDIAAVLTAAADCHYTVARTAEFLGLPHLSPEISQRCRNKLVTREVLTAAGLPQPRFFGARNYAEAVAFVDRHPGTSFVVKATDNSGSRGFSTVIPPQKLSEEQFLNALENGTTGQVIIEEMLNLPADSVSEASVETVWENGRMHWINWVDRIFRRDLRFFPSISLPHSIGDAVEIGHINPARHPDAMRQEVENAIFKAGCALGLASQPNAHILKADIFFSADGPVILELTPRISGGWDSSASSPARGADIVGGVVELALGNRISAELFEHYFSFKDASSTAVVLTSIPKNAENCIGRQFAIAAGHESTEALIGRALEELQAGHFIVPDLGSA
jgi:S-sulfo-L-cysteine synthase (3-phospho-L-serine-dependent)